MEDYISFIESPNTFIQHNSKETQMYFVFSNGKSEIEYLGYDSNNQSENIYSKGTLYYEIDELIDQPNVFVYNNNLQFSIQRKWEFTTHVISVSEMAITNFERYLKKKLKIKSTKSLTLDVLKDIVTTKRKEAHKCYTDTIGEINSHGFILLHGPIRFNRFSVRVYSECELNNCYNNYCCRGGFYDQYITDGNKIFLGTLLFGAGADRKARSMSGIAAQ